MLQGRVALDGLRVCARRGEWFGVSIHAVAVKPIAPFRGLRLRRIFGGVRAAPFGILITPLALPRTIGIISLVEAAEHSLEIFRVPETFLDDRGSVGVGHDVFVKPTIVG